MGAVIVFGLLPSVASPAAILQPLMHSALRGGRGRTGARLPRAGFLVRLAAARQRRPV